MDNGILSDKNFVKSLPGLSQVWNFRKEKQKYTLLFDVATIFDLHVA